MPAPGGGRPDVALLLPDLSGGGAERSTLLLGQGLAARGYAVDLVLERVAGGYVGQIPAGLRVIRLDRASFLHGRIAALRADPGGIGALARPVLVPIHTSGRLRYLPGLARYLRTVRPATVLAAMTYTNLQALWARRLAGTQTRIVISERNTLSARIADSGRRNAARWRYVPGLMRRLYPEADGIIAVSQGVADDLAVAIDMPVSRITTIYNPVVGADLLEKAAAPLPHPWLGQSDPVILGAGRLEPAKDFATLLRAFALMRAGRGAKLIILGEGGQRAELEALATSLGIRDDVALPGWVDNPFAYMARGRLFVLSSRFEGLPGVLIQALACGCPAVATDCPSGPREILAGGRHGHLAAIGDAQALARAMGAALSEPLDREAARRRGMEFSVDRAVDAYIPLLAPEGAAVPGAPRRRAG